MADPKAVTAFRLDVDLKAAATAKAATEGRTLTDVVTRALREYVGWVWPPPEPDTAGDAK